MEQFICASHKVSNTLAPILFKEQAKSFYLYSDEGGIVGIPRFIISSKILKGSKYKHFERVGKMSIGNIGRYIVGRLITWYASIKIDYTESVEICIVE